MMKLIDTYHKLKSLGQPVVRTNDAATFLDISTASASKTLSRLAEAKHIYYLTRGLWGFPENLDILAIPRYLTAPFPSYVSLQSALYYHGMISQLPKIIYAVSLARTRQFETSLGMVSVHHAQPDFFFGFEDKGNGVYMAEPEKALLDIFYLSQAKTKLFSALPEIELPQNFSVNKARKMIEKISDAKRRSLVKKKLEEVLGST
jgi:predicted transcriptional regulator of viral defense system